ncbi:class II heat shock protein [Sesamum alatum]|uniref:Class II heat shock protein n=1 Tax=Sesamum alatum TaxID=300844 RepID=A0AAE1YYN6_9LAMI|nr:class II heat shock protein [Sesamum alatum]
MESQMVRRRTGVIAAHLASHEDMSAAATHVFPMSCSNSLNTVIARRDNRTYFARQGSSTHGRHMRQASTEQGTYTQPETPCKSTDYRNKGPNALGTPKFSRPAHLSSTLRKKTNNFASKGSEWKPRMDVLESGLNYVVTLEIPGVSIDNIKVEVDDQSVIVTGNRSNWSCTPSNTSKPCYLRREILQGPYRIVWPLPTNANKEHVSAEIQDGLLRITIPKLSGLRWLRKAYM